jgi:glucose-6-phosphate 1-dehydrogenase
MTLFVLFGATGDLARTKLLPALFRCASRPGYEVLILGTGRSDWDEEAFGRHALEGLEAAGLLSDEAREWTRRHLTYQRLDETHHLEPALARARDLEQKHGLPGNRVYYLAVPPHVFEPVVEALGQARNDEARRAWETALTYVPGNPEALSYIAELPE